MNVDKGRLHDRPFGFAWARNYRSSLTFVIIFEHGCKMCYLDAKVLVESKYKMVI